MTKRPRRSNQLLTFDRNLNKQKVIYWTTGRLQKLLRRLIRKDREDWFAARIQALRSWPDRTREQILDDASRVNPTRAPDSRVKIGDRWRFVPGAGKWAWPKSELAIQRELLRSAPEDGIDIDALRKALDELSTGAGAELVELIADSELLLDTTVPLDTGLPQPKELPLGLLRRIKRLHGKLMQLIKDGHYDNDLREVDHSEVLHVPIANLKSSAGTVADMAPSDEEWAEIEDAIRALR
jgi:hypothetical protein